MNANQHYRRALGLLGKHGEPQDGMAWPNGDSARAQWHLAMGQALEGVERTAGADRAQRDARVRAALAQRESVKALTGFTDAQIDDLGGFPDIDLSNGTEPPPSRATIESIMRVVDGPAYPEGPLDRLDPEET